VLRSHWLPLERVSDFLCTLSDNWNDNIIRQEASCLFSIPILILVYLGLTYLSQFHYIFGRDINKILNILSFVCGSSLIVIPLCIVMWYYSRRNKECENLIKKENAFLKKYGFTWVCPDEFPEWIELYKKSDLIRKSVERGIKKPSRTREREKILHSTTIKQKDQRKKQRATQYNELVEDLENV
jgi:hypothetical protein